jgi:hypothetical protein
MRLWTITYSFRCGESHCWCLTPSVHFGPPPPKLAYGVNPVGRGRPFTRFATHSRLEHWKPARMIAIASHSIWSRYQPTSGMPYVGHTYWYLEATPQLMRDISQRCERFITGGHP